VLTRSKKGNQTIKVLAQTIMVKVKYGNMRLNIKNILTKNKLVILLILTGIFLRFYKLEEFVTFLGDQGRDAIIIKRIVTFEHFPAIGPISSIGHVFLGPFYYYLMSPFLAIFQLDPIGLAYGSAVLSIIGLVGAYFIARKELNKSIAVFFLFLMIFSYTQIDFARFSWNPNLLPFFSFFSLYFFYKYFTTEKIFYSIFFGALLAFSIQLHYLAILLIPSILVFFFLNISKRKWPPLKIIKGATVFFLSFLLCFSPLIIFDLKHGFLNLNSFLKIFSGQKVLSYTSFLNRLSTTNNTFFSYALAVKLSIAVSILLLLIFIYFFIKSSFFKKKLFLELHFINFFLYLLLFSFLNSFRLVHYYTPIYLSFFLILAGLIKACINKSKPFIFVIFILMGIYIFLNFKKYTFINAPEGNRQIWRAKMIAQSIVEKNPEIPYQVVPIPFTEMSGHIRYFLEILGKTPLSEESPDQPKELYILCYEKECDALNDSQWQIAAFKNKQVEKIWKVDRVKIYKLVHKE